MTNREFFKAIITGAFVVTTTADNGKVTETQYQSIVEDDEGNPVINPVLVAWAQKADQKIVDKNEKRRTTMTEAQKANEALKDKILEYMKADTVYLATTIANDMEISQQKASALLRQLAESGAVDTVDTKNEKKNKVKGYMLIAQLETAADETETTAEDSGWAEDDEGEGEGE